MGKISFGFPLTISYSLRFLIIRYVYMLINLVMFNEAVEYVRTWMKMMACGLDFNVDYKQHQKEALIISINYICHTDLISIATCATAWFYVSHINRTFSLLWQSFPAIQATEIPYPFFLKVTAEKRIINFIFFCSKLYNYAFHGVPILSSFFAFGLPLDQSNLWWGDISK